MGQSSADHEVSLLGDISNIEVRDCEPRLTFDSPPLIQQANSHLKNQWGQSSLILEARDEQIKVLCPI